MENATFTLKSGAKLHLSSAAWDVTCKLFSAVKLVTVGEKANPEVGDIILASPDVQKVVIELYPWATYNDMKMYDGIFDEPKWGPKIRLDYLEIVDKIITFHLRPFFLMTSSTSTDSQKKPTENPEQP